MVMLDHFCCMSIHFTLMDWKANMEIIAFKVDIFSTKIFNKNIVNDDVIDVT